LFGDESRFGTRTQIGYGWFKKNERTTVKVNIGYLAFYIYTAISAITGEHFSAKFPNVDTDCMNAFLENLSKHYEGKRIALIIDGAGWHKSKDLKTPKNIDIFLLPPYSPELNPVERFWAFVKQNILRNRLFESLTELQLNLEKFICSLQNSTIAQICKVNYMDI
jgi:transposase